MKRYRLREGVVLENVCGERLLIATFSARGKCPYILELNEESEFIWKGLMEGLDEEDIAVRAAAEFEVSREEALEGVTGFFAFLEQNGYLTEEKGQEEGPLEGAAGVKEC